MYITTPLKVCNRLYREMRNNIYIALAQGMWFLVVWEVLFTHWRHNVATHELSCKPDTTGWTNNTLPSYPCQIPSLFSGLHSSGLKPCIALPWTALKREREKEMFRWADSSCPPLLLTSLLHLLDAAAYHHWYLGPMHLDYCCQLHTKHSLDHEPRGLTVLSSLTPALLVDIIPTICGEAREREREGERGLDLNPVVS